MRRSTGSSTPVEAAESSANIRAFMAVDARHEQPVTHERNAKPGHGPSFS